MKFVKKTGACLTALFMIVSLFMSGSLQGTFMKNSTVYAKEGTAKTDMSQIKSSFGIRVLDRASNEGLWKITAGGKTTFCLNSGKSMCSGDTLSYKTHNAVTFKPQGIAKALTYYYDKSSKSDKIFGLIQAYIWACGQGVSKQDSVYQAGKNFDSGYSTSDAKKLCEKINKTDPEGTLYYYSADKCIKGKKHDKHQMLYRLAVGEVEAPEHGKLSVSDKKTDSEKLNIKIQKKDQQTGAALSGAEFEFYCDGKSVGTAVAGSDGVAKFSYTRNLETSTETIEKKYVKNWEELTKEQQGKETKKGYYASAAKAKSAANKELSEKLDKKILDLKSQSHTWKVKEIKAPLHHKLNEQEITKTEAGTMDAIDFGSMYDEYQFTSIKIYKKSTITDFGIDATFTGAVYGIYAKEDILGSDNQTILYKKDTEVLKIITDANGYGYADNLPQGKYYLKEITPPNGFQKSDVTTNVVLEGDRDHSYTVYDEPYTGKIRLHKTYDDDQKNEADAVFEVYNSQGVLADTIRTGSDGIAETKELPYGLYSIRQIKGKEGFYSDWNLAKNIDGTMKTYEIKINDPKEAARISIIKTKTIKDSQTSIKKQQPEKQAKFELIDKATKETIEVLTTDENGYVRSKSLNPGVYTVHQIKGEDNYAFVSDFDVELKEGDHSDHTYTLDDSWNGRKLLIKKTKEKNKKEEMEAGAEFIVLDASQAAGYKNTDLDSMQSRKEYINTLPKGAVIGSLTTDQNGTASLLLEDLESDKEFLVIQTKGEEDYSLSEVYDSREHNYQEADGMKVYEFVAKDIFSDASSIEITKEKAVSDTEYEKEAGAVFELIDLYGNVTATLTTGEDGTARAENIALGIYTLHQVKGSNQHELIQDQTIVLEKKDKGAIVKYHYKDKEKLIDLILSKYSKETRKLLDGATYTIYDKKGNEVAVLTTGSMEEGKALCKLPYGDYTIKEIVSPDGYNKNETEGHFTLNAESVKYDANGKGTYQYHETDEPVYGSISIKKTGEVLTGYDHGFVYESDQINGAVYGLYAKEDIKKDDDSIVWKAGELIDRKTTMKDTVVKFTRTGSDGKQTDQFYQGSYYVKEISGPSGYCIDTKEYEVIIGWDTKPGDMNEIRQPEDTADIEDPKGNNSPCPNDGIYVLEMGSLLNKELKDAQTITFTWEKAPSTAKTIDVSSKQDRSVVLWKQGNDIFISSQKTGQVIYMNTVSGKMFANCSNLESIQFKNIDTSGVCDMSEMFYACQNLKELDLSDFNTSNVENTKKMFYGCDKIKTIYVQNQYVKTEDDAKVAKLINFEVEAKNEFCVGDTYQAKDFIFTGKYDDDGQQEIMDITDADVTITPNKAAAAGEYKVTIRFKDSGKYKGYAPVQAAVKVIDPKDTDKIDLTTQKHIEINLEMEDILQKYSIRFIKTDEKGNKLKGATFALKAACDIVDRNQKIIFHKGDIISTTVSQNDQFGYIEFFGLPTCIYAKDGIGNPMYIVEELQAPEGYDVSNEKLSFSGSILNNKTENLIHDVTSQGNINTSEDTYIHDSKVIKNYKSKKITVKKNWMDDESIDTRPKSIVIKAVNKNTKEVKTYVLNKENAWMAKTDIDYTDKDDYTFEEICTTSDYTRVSKEGGEWNSQTYMMSYTNKYKKENQTDKVKIDIKKVWDDGADSDGIRPDSIKVTVYADGKETNHTATLNAANNWSASFYGLEKYDVAGAKINYEVREESTQLINGNAKNGYEVSYEESEKVLSKNTTLTVQITNTHKIKTTQKSIQKVWDDQNDQDKIRPESVRFHLLANGEIIDTVTLNKENGWRQKSKILPVYKKGKEIQYTWQEIKEGVITGEDKNGYNVSYEQDKKDADNTIATNHHIPRQGSIRLIKKDSNKKVLKGVKFMIKNSNQQLIAVKETDSKGSVLFDGLEQDTYTITEMKTNNGKNLLKEPFVVKIPLSMTQKEVNDGKVDTSGAVKRGDQYYFYDLVYEVFNDASLTLPSTGGKDSEGAYFPAACGLILLFAAGLYCIKRKN